MLRIALLLTLAICLCGCADRVGGEADFKCPVCHENTGQMVSIGEDNYQGFNIQCLSCYTKSGTYLTFAESTKKWPIAVDKESESVK